MTDNYHALLTPFGHRRTWWVEIHTALWDDRLSLWQTDYDRPRLVGIDTCLSVDSPVDEAIEAAERALELAGWRPTARRGAPDTWAKADGPKDRRRFVEPMPPGVGPSPFPVAEDGFLRRDGDRWTSHTPQVSRHPSPAYVIAATARRLSVAGCPVVLPQGYTLETLANIAWWTGSYSSEGVVVSDRQAHELGEIARVLTEQHADRLEVVSDFGDQVWGVAAVLRALETGRS
ncbi:hypothetical protein AB0451_03190 [Streptomyces sp. NPDC052000]|uniref:hypothetical protein n=1 Tax=Streptomyces sp. NPDC052000 TaxID=3155676 RepID=UPI00344D3724